MLPTYIFVIHCIIASIYRRYWVSYIISNYVQLYLNEFRLRVHTSLVYERKRHPKLIGSKLSRRTLVLIERRVQTLTGLSTKVHSLRDRHRLYQIEHW